MASKSLHTGFWMDFSKPSSGRAQILMGDYWAGVLTNAVAVLITSTSSPVFTLLIRPVSFLWEKLPPWMKGRNTALEGADGFHEVVHDAMLDLLESIPRLPRGGPRRIRLDDVNLVAPRRRRQGAELGGAGSLVIIFLGLPLAILVASILSVGIATDTVALSNSPHCGVYLYEPESKDMLGGSLEFEHRAEAQSAAYAADCYGSSPLVDDCNRFFNQSINYSTERKANCPFRGEVCDGGQHAAFKLSTGLVSGAVLGINARNPFFFSRTTTCSPLVTGEEYVGTGVSARGEKQWEYWYGPSLGAYTSANPVQASSWEVEGYSTAVHCSDPISGAGLFVPLPQFRAGPNPVTLIFVSSHSVFHRKRRNDPIFPAQQKAQLPPEYPGPDLFINNSTRAGVLGCTDEYQICRIKSGPCWNNRNTSEIFEDHSIKKSNEGQNVARLLLLALEYSSTCGAIQFRGAEALDAQKKLAHMQFLPLADQQWEVEAESLFRTSLARMQLNVFDVVRGSASNFQGYRNTLSAKDSRLCSMIKIKGSGVKNINVCGLLAIIFAVGFVWTISRRADSGSIRNELVAVLIWKSLLGGYHIKVSAFGEKACRRLWTAPTRMWSKPSKKNS